MKFTQAEIDAARKEFTDADAATLEGLAMGWILVTNKLIASDFAGVSEEAANLLVQIEATAYDWVSS